MKKIVLISLLVVSILTAFIIRFNNQKMTLPNSAEVREERVALLKATYVQLYDQCVDKVTEQIKYEYYIIDGTGEIKVLQPAPADEISSDRQRTLHVNGQTLTVTIDPNDPLTTPMTIGMRTINAPYFNPCVDYMAKFNSIQ